MNCSSSSLILFRWVVAVVVTVLLLLLTSPNASAQLFRFGKKEDPLPVVFNRMPTETELLQHLVAKSSKFRQLSSNIVVSLDGIPKLRGTMQMELPKRLRIKAGVFGVSQFGVDVGSNDQSFWVGTKVNLPNQKPAIFFASHEGFRFAKSSVRQAIPMEPVWLLEGLGLIQFEKTDKHILDRNLTPEGHLKLVSGRKTPNGISWRQTFVDAKLGLVLQQSLYQQESDGALPQLVAYTNSNDYKYFPKKGIALPQSIEMFLFSNGQQTKMVIDTSDYQFDSLYGDPAQMWSMPKPNGVQLVDLTQLR